MDNNKCSVLINVFSALEKVGFIDPTQPKPKKAAFPLLREGLLQVTAEVEAAEASEQVERLLHLQNARDILAIMNLQLPDSPRRLLLGSIVRITMFLDYERWEVQGIPPIATNSPLEEIRGIGPIFSRELALGGIKTLQDLAKSNPSAVRQILALQKWQKAWKQVPCWIREARNGLKIGLAGFTPAKSSKFALPAVQQPEVIQS